MRGIFTDKVKADALVAEYQPYISRAHPGRLTDNPGKGGVKVFDMASVERTPGIPTIAREDVADALLTIAQEPPECEHRFFGDDWGRYPTLTPEINR